MSAAALAALRDVVAGARPRQGTPFNPTTPLIGREGRQVIWSLLDASGELGGGGGAVHLPADDPARLLWSYRAWTPALVTNHSTYLEGLNANQSLRTLVARFPGPLDVIEILDNASWVFVARSGRAADSTLQDLLNDRADIRREHPHLRVFSVWTARELGQLQDAVSKLDLPHPTPTDSQSGHDWANHYLQSAGLPTLESGRRLPRL